MRDICPKCNSSTALGDLKCFKCGFTQRRYTSYNLLKPTDTDLELPEDIIYNPHSFHPDALAWLAKAYIFNDVIAKQGIGYCSNIHKVFIPAYDYEGELKFYQLRDISNCDPKYKYLTYGKSSKYLINYLDYDNNQVVIVEDHLPAIRLRRHTNVVCLSGTNLAIKDCEYLVTRFAGYTFWLDPDVPGRQAKDKCYRNLLTAASQYTVKQTFRGRLAMDYSFKYINYAKIGLDPKYYRDSEISLILDNEALLCENS